MLLTNNCPDLYVLTYTLCSENNLFLARLPGILPTTSELEDVITSRILRIFPEILNFRKIYNHSRDYQLLKLLYCQHSAGTARLGPMVISALFLIFLLATGGTPAWRSRNHWLRGTRLKNTGSSSNRITWRNKQDRYDKCLSCHQRHNRVVLRHLRANGQVHLS